MRSGPDRPAVAEENRLGRFVADAQSSRGFIRELTMTLNRDELVGRRALRVLDVCVQLVKCLAADAARSAVLEQQDGALARFRDGGVQVVEM